MKSDNIFIVSPFISSNFDFFPFVELKHLKRITLLTTLKPNNVEQPNKVQFFRQLFDFGQREDIEIEILIDNSLHGKLYICQKDKAFIKAIVTSANFTSNGLRINNEWGISIEEEDEIIKIVTELRNNVVIEPITKKTLIVFENKIKKASLPPKNKKYELNLIDGLDLKENPLNISTKVNYWLKPIGSNDNNIRKDRAFDEIDIDLHFSDKRPRGVKMGDILIAYAVGHKNILSIYRVNSGINNTGNPNDRWPYFVVGENLTPFYGKEWNNYNITISNQKQVALSKGIKKLTPSGENSYGSLMRGADKLKITKEYADYLIEKIVTLNGKIATQTNNDNP